MEKNTILAITLSIVVITAFYLIQYSFFTPPVAQQRTEISQDAGTPPVSGVPAPRAQPAPGIFGDGSALEDELKEEYVTLETNLAEVEFSSRGGEMTSFKLKEHSDSEGYVEMLLSGTQKPRAFGLSFGDKNAPLTDAVFKMKKISGTEIEFSKDFVQTFESGEKGAFRITKRYALQPNEYMFTLDITVESFAAGGSSSPILPNFDGKTYTLYFGPQIGPSFDVIDERSEFRRYHTFIEGKQKQQKVTAGSDAVINSHVSWAAIAGKYFAFFALPDETPYTFIFSQQPPEPGISQSARLFIERPVVKASKTTDSFKFYLGPKTQKALAIYDNANNAYKLSDRRMEILANASGFWGVFTPLEAVLKWMLYLFYKLVPNYGVAIILLTLLVKILLFPLTKKSSEGTLRMQALAPKMKELQEKYKGNPQKLNAELAAFYKKEKYNPMSGCLPMLIQFPIFIAMYNLFNNHFDLRNALFIPGWIPDLSRPESILHFDFQIPILGWSDIRLLPFLYVGSQLLYTKVNQTPDAAMNPQMKIMLYVMPVMFFFILYNMPSGLSVYWIASNVLTIVQQLVLNRYLKAKRAEAAAKNQQTVQKVTPPKKRKRK
ncbi:MAG: membrane protein insertase YidC [Spirochaetaceae bacterium]|jgi:YidC/Oxa1 family membrane protein insertase|nr:membrane protein insertase YidC [Spirochaetaceae bacterium]